MQFLKIRSKVFISALLLQYNKLSFYFNLKKECMLVLNRYFLNNYAQKFKKYAFFKSLFQTIKLEYPYNSRIFLLLNSSTFEILNYYGHFSHFFWGGEGRVIKG